ncbi:hypothetical protein L3H50_00665 [Corynebacterium sp. MC-04]|uniref:TobH protein n=1 Tax=Corynebacterium parakroppenstedtii TaxID=2828363 RepID=A0ABS9HJG0_9CORY|nr:MULTISPECIES: hypothetical protein [Corynebacterium]MDU3197215.1 hypothetical protein [Corynebacterium kroppenstedtii]MBY0792300.1 hypothetical protein [Corynebacterium parakroppenstedtii]MCF6769250.1 hypothetical protein [Corynebacterium parakroppenstedtii]MCF6770890.1 hypothetical protein [Corynebacterium parakroppenstedtii]MCF6772980.1 hypothetical protein [Corynebacterium parakroppenstedtii]
MYPRETLVTVAQEGARIRSVARSLSDVMSVLDRPTIESTPDGPSIESLRSDFFGIADDTADDSSEDLRSFAKSIPDVARGVVIVACSDTAVHAARAAVALIPDPSVPIAVVDRLPRYVGAMDCVIVLTPDPADREAEEAVVRCRQVGAMVMVAAPTSGPVAEAGSGYGLVVPDIPGAVEESWGRYVATVTGGCGLVGQLPIQGVLDYAADAVDREMEASGPERDESVNPARQLGLRMKDHRVVIAGDGATRHVASFAARRLLQHGIVAATADTAELARFYSYLHRGTSMDTAIDSSSETMTRLGSGAISDVDKSIFYDPFLDAPAVQPLAAVVVPGPGGYSGRGRNDEPDTGVSRAYPSEQELSRLERYFDARPVTVVDLTASDLHSAVAYICVLAARCAAAAAYVVAQE